MIPLSAAASPPTRTWNSAVEIGVEVSETISTGLCGAWNRSSARSRNALKLVAPRREALRRLVIMRGLLVPGFWPKMKMQSA
jgi:hypothetical protein